MKQIILLLACTLTAAAQQSAQDASAAFAQALLKQDVVTLKGLSAENLSVVWSNGKLYDRAELLDTIHEAAIREYSTYAVHTVPIDANSTIVTYDCIISMPEGDDGLAPRYQHVSELWRQQPGGEWKLRFLQFTPARPID